MIHDSSKTKKGHTAKERHREKPQTSDIAAAVRRPGDLSSPAMSGLLTGDAFPGLGPTDHPEKSTNPFKRGVAWAEGHGGNQI